MVWFWFAVTVMIVVAFFIARYFGQSWEITALDTDKHTRIHMLQANIQELLVNDVALKRAFKRSVSRGRWQLMAINIDTNELVLGFPSSILNQESKFVGLKDALDPVLIRTNNMEFAGPLPLVSNDGQRYALFVGHLLRRDQRPVFAFALAFAVFLITGTIACIGISWTITKPIRELSGLSKKLAKGGDENIGPSEELRSRDDELGQLHSDIHDMARNLAKSLSQQKALMANVSHELRTPLTRLQLALAMLNPNSDQQKQYAARIEKDIGVMDVLIGQALQLAKLNDENNAQWLQFEQVNLQTLLKPMLDDLSFEATASRIKLNQHINISGNLMMSLVSVSFVSAIENVTRNAIKYSTQQVNISIETLPATAVSETPILSICIEDDGQGLPDYQLSEIFEPFYRAPSGKQYQGTGLGLAIAKASVEMHNGEIKAESSSMGGLCLTLLLPITF